VTIFILFFGFTFFISFDILLNCFGWLTMVQKSEIVIEVFKFISSPLDGQEIGLALNKRILSTLKTLLRLIGPEVCQNNVFASASVSNVSKKEDGIFVVFEGLSLFLFVRSLLLVTSSSVQSLISYCLC
jgi:hypothetical protein